ncbi:TetR/AcrR family transcriptional regulator [Labedella endophytica]|uniref:TetR/AcrR family transcriptional regulator n=1 Tax=Labedella endophytica TaxID=1523160 RepID=A0A3S0X184_9MICO|nr:TetR/AcrR family transcriptional regulator [Labedella endophytica]RUR03539.1 TetR/AcrR family transcriptional regulator [Labedella endophytica]
MPRAGLDAEVVTEAGATLADEIGIGQLSMSILATRLGVKTPSLYKHVDGLGALTHRIAVLGATEAGDAVEEAVRGRSGVEALAAATQALRGYVRRHPGRYAATTGARPTGDDDPLGPALARPIASLAVVLQDYGLEPDEEIHALRMVRSMVHGFATIEDTGGFQWAADVDESFTWMIDFLDHGLRGRHDLHLP